MFEKSMPRSHLALSNDGEFVAQLHQSTVSVRSQRDEYSSLKWKYVMDPIDPAPQRQRLSWNCDGNLLAATTSDSKLLVFTRSGKLIHKLDVKMYQGKEVGGVVDIAWSRDSTIGGKRTSQLFVLTFAGILMRYLVYPHESDSMIIPLSQVLSIKDDPKFGPSSTLRSILDHLSVITCMDISPSGKYLSIAGYGRPFTRSSDDTIGNTDSSRSGASKSGDFGNDSIFGGKGAKDRSTQSSSSISSPSSPSRSSSSSFGSQGSYSHYSNRNGPTENVLSPSVGFWRILDVAPFFEFASPMYLDHLEPIKTHSRKSSKRCCGRRSTDTKRSPSAIKVINLVRDVQFSPDSLHLLTLDISGVLTIWDVEKQLPVRRYRSDGIWRLTNAQNAFPSASVSDRIVQAARWWTNNSVLIVHSNGATSAFGPLFGSESRPSKIETLSLTSSTPGFPHNHLSSLDDTHLRSNSISTSTNIGRSASTNLSSSSSSSSIVPGDEDGKEHNMLGSLPEKFAANSVVSRAHQQKVFIFESESSPVQVPRKRLLYSGAGSASRQDVDPDQGVPYEYEIEGAKQPSRISRAALSVWRFFVGHSDDTWGERTITKQSVTHRLLSLRNVTPEDLFFAKVSSSEHDFAIALAHHYNLNPDLVYQTKWRASQVSEDSIEQLLDKISDRDWVIHECIERVPNSLQATLNLLEYGLKHTVPSWMPKGSGNRKEILEKEFSDTVLALKTYALSRKNQVEALNLSSNVNIEKVKDEQETEGDDDSNLSPRENIPSKSDIKIMLQRLVLLSHYDRLRTYAKINDRNKHFDAREYLNFRTCSLVNACATFAQNEDMRALEIIWTHHGEATLPYRLIVLSYLPETLPADAPTVSYLYPSVAEYSNEENEEVDKNAATTSWRTQEWRQVDWIERPECLLPLLGISETDTKPISEHKRIEKYLSAYARSIRECNRGETNSSSQKNRPSGAMKDSRGVTKIQRDDRELKEEIRRRKLIEETPCEDIFAIAVERPEPLSLDKPISGRLGKPIEERNLTAGDLSKWYKMRAIEIESLSGQADNALALVTLGIRNGVPKLSKIHAKLKLLCSLVYDCGKNTELVEFEHMDDLRRLHFLLEDSTSSNVVQVILDRCEVYLHNAHTIWRQYEADGVPSFTSAYLTMWMCDLAKATASTSRTTLGYDMLPYLVAIFRHSAKSLSNGLLRNASSANNLSGRSNNSISDLANTSSSPIVSHATSSSQVPASILHTSPSYNHLSSQASAQTLGMDEPIIPTQYMLAVLGLHVLYLCTPLTKDHLAHIQSIYAVLPKRATSNASSSSPASLEASNSMASSAGTSSSFLTAGSHQSADANAAEQNPMEPLYDRIELLGMHLKAAEILLRHDLIKPLEAFFSSWRADDPLAIRMMLEHLVKKDVRANPNITNSKWRETLKDMQELREVLNSSRRLLDVITAASAHSAVTSSANSPSLTPVDSMSSIDDINTLRGEKETTNFSTPKKNGRFSPSHAGTPPPPSPSHSSTPGGSKARANKLLPSHASGLSVDLPYEIFCQALLRNGNFSLAKHYLYDLPNHEDLVISVAQEYFNSCSSAKDKDMELAQECLSLIQQPTTQTQEEQKLIDAVVQMSRLEDQFKVQMKDFLPIQVRRSRDRMSYLRQLLEPSSNPITSLQSNSTTFKSKQDVAAKQTQPEIYSNLEDLLALGRLLGCASSDAERQEIKLLAANRAYKARDYEIASKWCIELTSSPSASINGVWDLAYRLAMVEKVDISIRTQLLAFSMRYAPEETLQSMVSLWRALELRSGCSSIGIKVDMPRGTPTHLHLSERNSSSSSSSTRPITPSISSSPHVQGMSQNNVYSQMLNTAHGTTSSSAQNFPDPLSLRLDPKKVKNTQEVFMSTCIAKLEEMNATTWMQHLQSAANNAKPENPHLYGFYRSIPNRAPYHYSDTQLRVDPATGPLATFGDAAIEREILSKIRSLFLASSSSLVTTKLEKTIIQLAKLSATSGDISMFMALLLDPSISQKSVRDLFDSLLELTNSKPVASTLLHLAKYHFSLLALQLYLSYAEDEKQISSFDLAELQHYSLFDYNPLQLIQRAKKFISKAKAIPNVFQRSENFALNRILEESFANWDHFESYDLPSSKYSDKMPVSTPSPPLESQPSSSGSDGRQTKEKTKTSNSSSRSNDEVSSTTKTDTSHGRDALLEMAMRPDAASLERALQIFSTGSFSIVPESSPTKPIDIHSIFDEFTLLEAHFITLMRNDVVPIKAINAFLQRYDDELTRHHTLRFESTLETLWRSPEANEKPLSIPRLLSLLNLKMRACKHHEVAAAAHPNIANALPDTIKYGTRAFADRTSEQAAALENLAKSLRAHAASAPPPNDLAWRTILDGNFNTALECIKRALTIENVQMIAKSSKPLNRLIEVSRDPNADISNRDSNDSSKDESSANESVEEEQKIEIPHPEITSSLVYLSLAQTILDPIKEHFGKGKEIVASLPTEMNFFKEILLSQLDATHLHQFIEQYIVSSSYDLYLRVTLCEYVSEYLQIVLEGEEDETVLFLRKISKHLNAIASLRKEWITSHKKSLSGHTREISSDSSNFASSSSSTSLNIAQTNSKGDDKSYFLKLLDETFGLAHPNSEIALIVSRMFANGLPVAFIISVIEAFELHLTFNPEQSVLEVTNRAISESIRTVAKTISSSPPSNDDSNRNIKKENVEDSTSASGESEKNSKNETILEWPPSNTSNAHLMLRTMLKSVTQAGSTAFCRDSLSAVRETAYSEETAPEARVSLLRALLEFPSVYETKRDWIVQDERCVERFIIENILETSSDLSSSDVATKSLPNAQSATEKLASIKGLVEKKNFETAFQLLWMWSSKAQKEENEAKSQLEAAKRANQGESSDGAQKNGTKIPFALADSVEKSSQEEEDGWGFEDAIGDIKVETSDETSDEKEEKKEVGKSSPVGVASLLPAWKCMFRGVLDADDFNLIIRLREKVPEGWLDDEKFELEIYDSINLSSPINAWKYSLASGSNPIIKKGVDEMQSHFAKIESNLKENEKEKEKSSGAPKDTSNSSNNLRNFFKGFMTIAASSIAMEEKNHFSSRESSISSANRSIKIVKETLKYGVDYDADLLLLLVRSGVFVEFSESALLWPLILEFVIFVLKPNRNGNIELKVDERVDYEAKRGETENLKFDASFTFQRIVTDLILSSRISPAAIVAFEQLDIPNNIGGGFELRNFEKFLSLLPALFKSYETECKHQITIEKQHQEQTRAHLGLSTTIEPRVEQNWSKILERTGLARNHIEKLKL